MLGLDAGGVRQEPPLIFLVYSDEGWSVFLSLRLEFRTCRDDGVYIYPRRVGIGVPICILLRREIGEQRLSHPDVGGSGVLFFSCFCVVKVEC